MGWGGRADSIWGETILKKIRAKNPQIRAESKILRKKNDGGKFLRK